MVTVKNDCINLIQEYLAGAKGPAKSEALAIFFQTWVVDSELTELFKQIDQTYEAAMNKIKLMISES